MIFADAMDIPVQEIWQAWRGEIVSFGLYLLGALIIWFVQARPRLIWGVQHSFAHRVQADDQHQRLVHSAALVIVNRGRAAAKNTEITLTYEPTNLEIWPPRQYDMNKTPDGRPVISFNTIGPGQSVEIHMLNFDNEVPLVNSVNPENCGARRVPIRPNIAYPRWVMAIVAFLLFVGIGATIYLTIQLLGFILGANAPPPPSS